MPELTLPYYRQLIPREATNIRKRKPAAGRGAKRQPPKGNPIDHLGATVLHSRHDSIFYRPQPARHIYKIETGCVRVFANQDGRRLVTGFYFPGDYFGLEMRERHRACADALIPSAVLAIERRAIELRAMTDPAVARFMLDITLAELHRAREHSALLRDSANDRVANFLLAMKNRGRSREVELTMSRQDIADYLNLTIESVSRALTQLENSRKISFLSHRCVDVRIRKRQAA